MIEVDDGMHERFFVLRSDAAFLGVSVSHSASWFVGSTSWFVGSIATIVGHLIVHRA